MSERNRFRPGGKPRNIEADRSADEVVYKYILGALEHFAGTESAVDEGSLVRICLAGGSKSPTQARKVIDRMVAVGALGRQVDRKTHKKSYYIPKAKSPEVN